MGCLTLHVEFMKCLSWHLITEILEGEKHGGCHNILIQAVMIITIIIPTVTIIIIIIIIIIITAATIVIII